MTMVISLITSISFIQIAWIASAQQPGYVDAQCAGLPITALEIASNIAHIINPGATITQQTYTLSNAPVEFDGQTPNFLASAVDPISGEIYVVVFVRGALDSAVFYLGILNPTTTIVSIIAPNNPFTFGITGITFDCSGILYAISFEGADIYTIDTITSNTELFEDGSNKKICGEYVDCTDKLAYNYNNNLLYRISSAVGEQYLLYVRQNDGSETVYALYDPNGYCTTNSGGAIRGIEWIGNDFFLMSCGGSQQGVYLLDTRNIAFPEIIDISATGFPVVVGIIPSDLVGSVCVPPSCVTTTLSPSKTSMDGKDGDSSEEDSGRDESNEDDVILIEDNRDGTGDIIERIDDDLDDGDIDVEDNSPEESNEFDDNKDGEIVNDRVLFRDNEGNGKGNIENEDDNNDIGKPLFMLLVFSWAALVIFLIGSIVVFCYYRKNEQMDLIPMNVLHVEKL